MNSGIHGRAKFFDPDELCSAGICFRKHRGIRTSDTGLFTSPWASLNNNFKFRAGELTLVNGVNGHGKTELVGHIAIDAMSQGSGPVLLLWSLNQAKCLPDSRGKPSAPPHRSVKKSL
jgi:twinkle protein